MRRLLAPVLIVGIAAFGLVGCSASADGGCPRPAPSDRSALDLLTVTGDLDEAPELEAYTPVHTDETVWEDLETGTGTAIISPDQLTVLDITLFDGDTGEEVAATGYDGSLANVFPVSQWTQALRGLADALDCAREGTRVVTVIPPDALDQESVASLGVEEGTSVIGVVDLRKIYLSKADGANQFVVGRGMPTVVRAPDGRPGIIIPDGQPPAGLQYQVLKKGEGAAVSADDSIRVAYTGVTWADRTVFDTTWGKTPASVTIDGVVEGFGDALEGQTVGSQILVVIPPELGYGDEANGAIPAGSTLVFVIDILGIDAPAE